MTMKIFLFVLIFNTIQAKTYERCEFIKELVEKYNFKEEVAAKVSCIAERAVFETNRVIYHPRDFEDDEPQFSIIFGFSSAMPNYGIFQISSEFWCSETGIGGICEINCEKFIDDDISDDIECLKKIVPNFDDNKWGYPWKFYKCIEKEIIETCTKNEKPKNKIWTSLDDCIQNFPNFYYSKTMPGYAGVPALKHEFPHAAAIGWSRPESNDVKWGCGGSLISEDTVMTAAHCMINSEMQEPDVVRFGDLNIETDDEDTDAQQFEVLSIIRHPEYKPRYNDIALIKLKQKVNITKFVMPACLWTKQKIPRLVQLEACGYGQTEFLGDISPVLIKIIVSTIEKDECQAFYDDDRKLRQGLVERIHLCANDKTGHKMDTCEGDSGGPLEMKLNFNTAIIPFIVGVTAFGKGCGFDSPGVYTRVSSYIDWIKKHIPDLEIDPIRCSEKFLFLRAHQPHYLFSPPDFQPQKIILRVSGAQTSKATIISDRFLLTTASSLKKPYPDRVALSTNSSQIIIDKIIYHPNYVKGRPDNDLALIKLKSRIYWHYKDHPACISKKALDGIIYQHETYNDPKIMRNRDVSIDSNHTNCQQNEDFICFKNEAYHVPKTCDVLKGSPVIQKRISENPLQSLVKGFAIHSEDCTFTTAIDVSKHFDWINSVVFGPTLEPVGQNNDSQSMMIFRDSDLNPGDACVQFNGRRGACKHNNQCINNTDGPFLLCNGNTICC